ncbi:hypothetical protein ACK8N7_10160 [Streptomyces griseobrunneus]
MTDLDIVGGAAVDVVPVIPQFHAKLKALVLPIADRVGSEAGERMGQAMSRSLAQHLTINIPSAINRAGQAGQAASRRQGDQNAGAFAGSMKRHLQAAFKAMPKLEIGISAVGADAELARLRSRLEQLSNKRIGVDIDAMAARAEVVRLERELERLGAQHPNVAVRADTAAARAALVAMRDEIDAIDRRRIDVPVKIDTSQASAALLALGIQMGATAAVPLGPIIAAGLGAVVTMAAAAGAGVGALALAAVPAIKGVTEALTAKTAAEKESANATDKSAQVASQAASKALQMAGAQASLASAHRNAAASIAQANRQIEVAERAVADAATRAAEQRKSAADGVKRAETSLTDAKRTARQAEDDLTQARKTAAQQLAELEDRLIDSGLAQRDAALRVTEAQQELAATMADPKATDLQRAQSQLAYDQAVRNADRQKADLKALQEAEKKQRKAGVEGSEAVQDAQERLRATQRGVTDATDALRQAQDSQTKAAVAAARSIADAQERVSDATRSAAEAQVSAADQIANAERGLASARLSSTTSTAKAVTKADEYKAALEKLTGPQRALFESIAGPSGLTKAFKAWSKELQPAVLPLFTRAVDGAKNSLPGLTPLVLAAADGIGILQDKASKELDSPFWDEFKKGIAESAEPAIVGLGVAFGNVLKGIAGVIDAFLPHMDGIADRSDSITERFARWGSSLKGSPEFEKFLDYVKETAPGVGEFLGDVLTAAIDVSKAIAPLSTTVMAVIGPVFEAVSWLAQNHPELIVGLWGIYAAQKAIAIGMTAFAAAMYVYQSVILLSTIATAGFGTVLAATGIGPIIRAIVLVVGLLIAGFTLAYQNSETFRKIVDGAWAGIQAAVDYAWNRVIKPAFNGIWTGMKAIGAAAVWLWSYLGPVFGYIYEGAKLLVTGVITLFLLPAYLAFKALGAIAMWLWEKAVGPAFKEIGADAMWLWTTVLSPVFGWIGTGAKWLYANSIKPAFKHSKESFEQLANAGKWLWREILQPVFGWIGNGAELLYTKHLKPAFKWMRDGIKAVADSFEDANSFIDEAWSKVADIAKEPIKVIIDTVYNGGILPVWNAVAKITDVDDLKPLQLEGFYNGGIMSGYSPGRDDRVIAVGGGEAILRPEVTRALGHDPINTWNAAARSGGVGAVQRAISNGMPAFADGGIVDKLWGGVKSVGSSIMGTAEFLTNPDKVFNAATGWAKEQMKEFASSRWGQMATKIPVALLKSLKNSLFGGDGNGTSATGSVGNALMWARSQAGKPYQWGGAGDPSFDCSGFMSSIQKVILGQIPTGRLWSTFSFQGDNAPAGWVRNLRSPFQVGITNAGVGHTAGTLAGVNVESRGGDGVVVGKGARGWNDSLFTDHYGFAPAIGKKIAGYASGGFPQIGETAWVGERGPELLEFLTPTKVHSNSDSTAMARATQSIPGRGSSDSATVPNVIVKNYIDGQEVAGFVDSRIDHNNEVVAQGLATGRIL